LQVAAFQLLRTPHIRTHARVRTYGIWLTLTEVVRVRVRGNTRRYREKKRRGGRAHAHREIERQGYIRSQVSSYRGCLAFDRFIVA
jgi:hypothetical protein